MLDFLDECLKEGGLKISRSTLRKDVQRICKRAARMPQARTKPASK